MINKQSPTQFIIEVDSTVLVDFTREIWEDLKKSNQCKFGDITRNTFDSDTGYRQKDVNLFSSVYNNAKKEFPFVAPKVVFLEYPPTGGAAPHCDGGPTKEDAHAYNFIVPIEVNDQTVTTFYDDCELVFVPELRTRLPKDLNNLVALGSTVIKKPTLLYTQQPHSAKNNGTTNRIVATWKIAKEYSIDSVLTWFKTNGVTVETVISK